MRTIETKVYTIDEHPNPSAVYEWIRDNWHDLNQHSVDEMIDSIKALSNKIGGSFDYSISAVPDRGEFIRFKDYDQEALAELNAGECPLTGVCWDADLIEALQKGDPSKALESIHYNTEHIYSDKGLEELCESNEYEFTEEGNVF